MIHPFLSLIQRFCAVKLQSNTSIFLSLLRTLTFKLCFEKTNLFTPNMKSLKLLTRMGAMISSLLLCETALAVGTTPTATTEAATDVSYYSATLNATVTSNGAETTVSFEIGTDITYGTPVTALPATVNSESVTIVGSAVDLLPNTVYHFRVVATNSFGTTYGDDVTFTTWETVPEIYLSGGGNEIIDGSASPSLTNLTDFGSTPVTGGFVAKSYSIQNTGNANLDLDGSPIVGVSGTHASDFTVTVQPSSTSIAPSSSASFTVKFDPSATGLRTATISVSNSDSNEDPYDFVIQGTGTADPKPTATTDAASSIGAYTAILNATVNGNGLETTVSFEYGQSPSFGSTVSYGTLEARGGGTTDVPINKAISGLSPNYDYQFRVVATNASGTTYGSTLDFATLRAIPEIQVFNESNLDIVNDNQSFYTQSFGSTGETGGSLPKTFTIRNSGVGNLSLSGTPIVEVSGSHASDFTVTSQPSSTTLAPGGSTTFTVTFDPTATGARTATLSIANDDSDENPFVIYVAGVGIASPTGPDVTTAAASSISVSSATLNGSVDDLGSNTTVTFEYGTTTGYGTQLNATPNSISAGTGTTAVSLDISGLTADTEYHFRVVGSNGFGTSEGSDLTFTTSDYTPVTLSIADTPLAYTENDAATQLDSAASLVGGGEVEWSNSTVTVQITGNPESTDELSIPDNVVGSINTVGLDIRSGSLVIGTVSAAEGTVTGGTMMTISFNGNANRTYVEQVIRALSYRSTSEDPSTSDRIVTVVAKNSYLISDTDTRTIQVQADNDDPSLTTNLGLTLNEGATASIGTSILSASDDDNSDTELTYTVTTGSINGQLENTDASGTPITSFTQQNLVDGKIVYVHDDTDTTLDSFIFTLSDGVASLTGNTFSITVNAQPDLPLATTDSATSVGVGSAVLNGTVDDRDGSTTVTFEYGLDNSYGTTVTADQSPIASGTGSTSVSKTITGLTGGITYSYRVVATNSAGTTNGSEQTFYMPEFTPVTQAFGVGFSATTLSSTTITWTRGNGANCVVFVREDSSGSANPVNNSSYNASTTFGSGTQIGSSGWYCVYNGTGNSVQLGGLSVNKTYRAQVFEYNGSSGAQLYNKNSGSDNPANASTFLLLPTATTAEATSVSYSGATLNGSVNDNGGDTQVTFEYGFNTSYGNVMPASPSTVSAGSGDTSVSAVLNGLTKGGIYHFRVVATNAAGTTNGSDFKVRIILDTEDDGIEDELDFDDDNDGIPDLFDKFPLNGNESVDTDGDGIGDNADADDDNDGVPDDQDAFPNDPKESTDTDGDGIGDNSDPDPLVPLDTDGDGDPDFSDPDDDNDGIPDVQDAFPLDVKESIDTDFDGIGNNADPDDDGDGVADGSDAFPLDPLEWLDSDGDGVGDNSDAFPSDPTEAVDTDGDGTGDQADLDADGDGVADTSDAFPLDASESVDSDGDGVGDNLDLWPNDPSEALDTDGDGVGNNTDPDDDNDGILDIYDAFPLDPNYKLDTDGDGSPDASDAFPSNPFEQNDNDFDGIGDNYDPDDDNDGIPDVSDPFPFSPIQSPLVLAKGYRYNRDTNTYLMLDLKADTLLDSQNLTFELLTPLPPGIVWNAQTGVFSGVVSQAKNYIIEAIVSDGSFKVHVYYYVNISDPVVNPIFTNYELNSVMSSIALLQTPGLLELGVTESVSIQIPTGTLATIQFFTDYRPAYSGFGLMSGDLPSGMSLNADTGLLSGTPEEATTSVLVIYLLSWKGWAYQEVNLEVLAAPAP